MIEPIDRGIVCEGYCNHVGGCQDQWQNGYAAFTQERVKGKPGLLIRRRQHGRGDWETIAEIPAKDGTKYGYAEMWCVGTHLVVLAPERQLDGTNPVREYLIPNAVKEFA